MPTTANTGPTHNIQLPSTVSKSNMKTGRCLVLVLYIVRQKTALFYFCNNFDKSLYIVIIIGTHIP